MATEETTIKLPGTPKPWMNAAVMRMLRLPLLGSWMGKTFLVLTVTGAKSGKRYTLPVQYVQDGNRLLVLSQRKRIWWKNLRQRTEVEIVLRGDTVATTARLVEGDDAAEAIATTLRLNPRTAKFYDIAMDDTGEPDPTGVEQLDQHFVVIAIDLS